MFGFLILILASTGHLKTGPFEVRTFLSGFLMIASLDRFIKKRVMNKIFVMPKQSRLAEIFGPVFKW
jgi:hypothetical protein